MPATRTKTRRRIKREEDDEAPYIPRGGRAKPRARTDNKARPKRRQPCDHCKSTRHRCIVSSVNVEDEDLPDCEDDAKEQSKLPCDACIASGRDCTYGVLEIDWQGRKRSYGILTEMDERLAKLEALVLRKTGATSTYELDDLDDILVKVEVPQATERPPTRDVDDGVRRCPVNRLPPLPLPPLPYHACAPQARFEPSVDHKVAFAQDLFESATSFWPANPLASGLTWRQPFLQHDDAATELAAALSTLGIAEVPTPQPSEQASRPALSKLSMPAPPAIAPLPPTPDTAHSMPRDVIVACRPHAWIPAANTAPLTPPLALYEHSLPTPVASPVTPIKTVSITTHVHPYDISPPPDSCLWRYFSQSAPVLPASPPPSVRSTRSRTSSAA